MRLGPATQAALLSRTFYLPSFAERDRRAKAHRATHSQKCQHRCSPKARAFRVRAQQFHPSRKKDFRGGRKARAPAHWTCAGFPPAIHSREITGNAEPFSQQISERLTLLTASTLRQRKDLRNGKLRLHCVNTVERRNFLWNGKEKVYFYWRRIRGENRRSAVQYPPVQYSDDCASSRNAAGEASEPGDRGNSRSRL
jgi:hypothetical protein